MLGGAGGGDDDSDIWIAVINSATKLHKKNPNIWEQFGLSIFDECHMYCSATRLTILQNCQTKYKLALSATVEKNWNWKEIIYNCGALIDGNKIIFSKKIPGKVKVIRYYGPPEYTQKLRSKSGLVCSAYMSDQFSQDDIRNTMIVNELIKQITKGHKILAFTDIKKFVYTIKDLIDNDERFIDVHVGVMTADQSSTEKAGTISDADIILTTYQSCSTGINIPRMTCAVFMTSFKDNGIQISGRVLRGSGSDKVRKYIDIVDQNTSIKSRFLSRKKIWEERGYPLKEVNVGKK